MQATLWNRARLWTPVTVTTNKKHLQKHGCQQQHEQMVRAWTTVRGTFLFSGSLTLPVDSTSLRG
jgi:hypothetical protein